MQSAANILIAQSHIEDLHRAAAARALRAETRRAARSNAQSVSRELVFQPSRFRRMVARFA